MTKTQTVNPPLKWHGGKAYLARRIVAMMPPHMTYCEPYAGGLSVLLAKDPEGVSEVVNDLHGELTNFWAMLQNTETFAALLRLLDAVPFGEADWVQAGEFLASANTPGTDRFAGYGGWSVARAAAFFVRCRQSLAGRMDRFAPVSTSRTRRGMNEQVSAWLTAVEGLPAVHARLKRVLILNRDALDVIQQLDHPETLFYLDPPYLHETRAATGQYEHEMTEEQHRHLLMCCTEVKGKFLLSGYRSKLYDEFAATFGWHRTDFDLPNNAAGGKEKRRMTECVWSNFEPA